MPIIWSPKEGESNFAERIKDLLEDLENLTIESNRIRVSLPIMHQCRPNLLRTTQLLEYAIDEIEKIRRKLPA